MPARRQPAHKANDDADELLSTVVPAQVRALYGASQHSVASHRKHVNALYALFLRASKVRLDDGENVRLTGEKAFVDALRAVLVYVLAIKRGVEQADRLVKFTAAFIGFAVEQGASYAVICPRALTELEAILKTRRNGRERRMKTTRTKVQRRV